MLDACGRHVEGVDAQIDLMSRRSTSRQFHRSLMTVLGIVILSSRLSAAFALAAFTCENDMSGVRKAVRSTLQFNAAPANIRRI